MDQNTTQPQASQGAAVLVGSGTLLGELAISSDLVMRIEQPLRVNFVPMPDITAYELSSAMPFFFGQIMNQAAFSKLGDAKRHWQHF